MIRERVLEMKEAKAREEEALKALAAPDDTDGEESSRQRCR